MEETPGTNPPEHRSARRFRLGRKKAYLLAEMTGLVIIALVIYRSPGIASVIAVALAYAEVRRRS